MKRPPPPLLLLLLVLHAKSGDCIYVHTGAVTTQTATCGDVNIGAAGTLVLTEASSFGGTACDPRLGAGRIGHVSALFWCPSKPNPYEYYQISLDGGPTKLGGLHMQGTVTKFEVGYALNDIDSQYMMYHERDQLAVFTNAPQPNVVDPTWTHKFRMPGQALIQIQKEGMGYPLAQHIRIYPKEWQGGVGAATFKMKVDIIACVACGDGFTDRTEQCDDGNLVDGDGCSGVNAVILGTDSPCSRETNLGLFWCEPMTDGPRRGNAIGDCLYRKDRATGTHSTRGGHRVLQDPQKMYFASKHYDDRGGISTGGYNSGILPLCDGVVCDGQNPYG